jgi:hypothetical protein
MGTADKDILYKVAYDEAVRALSEQQGTIDSFRTRAGLCSRPPQLLRRFSVLRHSNMGIQISLSGWR